MLIAICHTLESYVIPQENDLELLWVRIPCDFCNLIIAVCYRPPNTDNDFLQAFEASVMSVMQKFPSTHSVITDDFNLPCIDWNTLSVQVGSATAKLGVGFMHFIKFFQLTQVVTRPTRLNSFLDLILVSHPGEVLNISYVNSSSDHLVLCADIQLGPRRIVKVPKIIYDYSKANIQGISEFMSSVVNSMNDEYKNSSVEHKWNTIKKALLDVREMFVPKRIIPKNSNEPWFTRPLRSLANKKKRLYHSAKQQQTSEAWQMYRDYNRQFKQEVKRAKEKFYTHDLGSILRASPSKAWRVIKPSHKHSGVAILKSLNPCLIPMLLSVLMITFPVCFREPSLTALPTCLPN